MSDGELNHELSSEDEDNNGSNNKVPTKPEEPESHHQVQPLNDALSLRENEVELDYEAEEDDPDLSREEEEREKATGSKSDEEGALESEDDGENKREKTEKGEIDEEPEEGEELEEGELSDEDEETRKERLKPQPVCRFYNKGQCTWGASCRFVHPGVLDKGNYSMFAPPRPILPGTPADLPELSPTKAAATASPATPNTATPAASPATSGTTASLATEARPSAAAFPPRPETAWERGLRQAKEMKRLSQQRKETDVEYEEKRTAMSLTQAELDKENDYYTRQASPIRDNDSNFGDDFDEFLLDDYGNPSTRRRIAPPPPVDFYPGGPAPIPHRAGRGGVPPHVVRRYPPLSPSRERYSMSPPPQPRVRRIAPPRSPHMSDDEGIREHHIPPTVGLGGPIPRHRADDWADPWMRGGPRNERERMSPSGSARHANSSRRRSYSSGSSHSSSRSSSGSSRSRSRSRTRGGRRGRSSSESSRSSRGSSHGSRRNRSRSRSSTPKGIPRRSGRKGSRSPKSRSPTGVGSGRNHGKSSSAPLQKRLGSIAGASSGLIQNIKQEPVDVKPNVAKLNAAMAAGVASSTNYRRRRSRSSSGSSRSSSKSPPHSRRRRMSPGPKSSSGLPPLSSRPNRPAQIAATKIVQPRTQTSPSRSSSRQPDKSGSPQPKQQIRMTLKNPVKPVSKAVLEKLGNSREEEDSRGDGDNHGSSSSRNLKRKAEIEDELNRVEKSVDSEKASKKSDRRDRDRGEKKKEKKSAADRREELLKQLKAVENAIAKKRTKINSDR